jgi:hypothetical protein
VEPDPDADPNVPTWSGPRAGLTVDGDVAKIRVTVTTIRFRDGTEYHRDREAQP